MTTPSPSLPVRDASRPTPEQEREREHTRNDRNAHAAASHQEAAYDAELVRRGNAGDESAFVEIMARYKEKIFSVALALLRNRADAEEIAQDTFIRAHRGLSRFRGDSSLATWLHRIAVNLGRNRYWYFYRRRRHATLSLDCAFSEESDATFADLVATDAPSPAPATGSNRPAPPAGSNSPAPDPITLHRPSRVTHLVTRLFCVGPRHGSPDA